MSDEIPRPGSRIEDDTVPGRVLLVKYNDDKEAKIIVPAEATLTFGPTVPYVPKGGFQSTGGWSLRVWGDSGKKELLAVFSGVVSFRDEKIKVHKLVVREEGKTIWKSDEDGFSLETTSKRARKLVSDDHLLVALREAE